MNGRSRICADVILLSLLLLLLSCWLGAGLRTASANGVYTITETELNTLDSNLQKLEQISVTQQQELGRLKTTLETSKQELAMLKNQLNISKEQLTQAQTSLSNANQLLQQYAEEEKRTRLRIKRQRNMWIGFTITAIIVAIATH